MIEKFGPLLYLHPNEKYKLANPDDIIASSQLGYGLVNESDWRQDWDSRTAYDKFKLEHPGAISRITAATLMSEVTNLLTTVKPRPPYNNSSNFCYWLQSPESSIAGKTATARALVRVLPVSGAKGGATELQFWFYYPFQRPRPSLVSRGFGDRFA